MKCELCGALLLEEQRRGRFCNRSCAAQSRSKLDHGFFSVPNILNSYYAGFIAADGCISLPKVGSPQLRIVLKSDDGQFLAKMLKDMRSNLKVVYSTRKRSYKSSSLCEMAWLTVTSKQIAYDLERNFNITPKKSLTLQPPTNLDRECSLAYIAGLVDGDGCYTFNKTSNRPVLSIVGTKSVLEWVKDTVGYGQVHPSGSIYQFYCSGDDAIRARDSYIDMPLPFLERKYRRWESLDLNLKLLDRGQIKHGTPEGFNKYKCKCAECSLAYRIYRQNYFANKYAVKRCEECGVEYQPTSSKSKYCGNTCSAISRERKRRDHP